MFYCRNEILIFNHVNYCDIDYYRKCIHFDKYIDLLLCVYMDTQSLNELNFIEKCSSWSRVL